MPRISEYKRSKKLYTMGDKVFVKGRHWPMSIQTEDGVTLEREDPIMWDGEPIMWDGELAGYQYVASFDDATKDPSYPDSDAYGGDTPEVPEGEEFVPQRLWPEDIDLTDGTTLRKTYTAARKGMKRFAYYYVENWGDLDPSLPDSEAYEGEFDKPGKWDIGG